VTVRTGEIDGAGVRFTVEDNGIGMDAATQKRIFEDFFSTKGYKGTGLGLTVTKKIIEEHHGSLTFSSEPGAAKGPSSPLYCQIRTTSLPGEPFPNPTLNGPSPRQPAIPCLAMAIS
jgi:signal transduction histidine kinase